MNVLVVGAGSIGARRARIAASLGHSVYVSDVDEGAACTLAAQVGGHVREPNADADVALVCTPPETHADVVHSLALDALAGLYVEKPLALDTDDLQRIIVDAAYVPVTMGACNMRFAVPPPPEQGDGERCWLATMGQHERHWSPGHRPISMILDSIHELDLLWWLAGPVTQIIGHSDLIYATVETKHASGDAGMVVLNRVADPPGRFLRYDTKRTSWSVDLWPPDPDMYVEEMAHLFSRVDAGEPTTNPLSEAAEVCRWALEVA